MKINLFDYILPDELIAQQPLRNRDESRLLVHDRSKQKNSLRLFKDLSEYIQPGDCLIVNNTKVFKARLLGKRSTGAEVEVFLVRRDDTDSLSWEALAQPSRRLKENEKILFDDLNLTLIKNKGEGRWLIKFDSKEIEENIIENHGHVPLPQYIKRDDTVSDVSRYQTIFAKDDKQGAVAAPTAGFHFTPEIVEQLKAKGVNFGEVTLNVGPGTFKPVQVDDVDDHFVDAEYAELTQEAADLINKTKQNGGAVFAVGTTSVRTIESAEIINGQIQPFSKFVDLYIKPGYKFNTIDHLITNFHLPKSSLLILVSAFASRQSILVAYQKAIDNGLRFYSYGDSMLIL